MLASRKSRATLAAIAGLVSYDLVRSDPSCAIRSSPPTTRSDPSRATSDAGPIASERFQVGPLCHVQVQRRKPHYCLG
jgi:hypothetical protein